MAKKPAAKPAKAPAPKGGAIKEYKSGDIVIKIDHDKCTGDANCVDVCPVDVYELVEGKSTAPRVEDCTECCACVEGCPEGAIQHSSC